MNPGTDDPHGRAFTALLDACRLWLGTEPTGELASTALDWTVFERLAFVHHLEPLLYHLRSRMLIPRADIPAELGERWETAYFENLLFNTRVLEIVCDLCVACEERGAPVAVIKGPVAAARAFGDPGLRIMVDVDLLCRERDLTALVKAARAAGFGAGEENATYHQSLQHEELPLLLELHFRLYDFIPDGERAPDQILERRESCRVGDTDIPALPRHLETAIELAHLVNHDLRVNLKSLLDLAGAARHSPLDPRLSSVLERWDLEPEAATIGRLLARLFALESLLAAEELPEYGDQIIDAAAVAVEHIEDAGRPALEELLSRPDLTSRAAYLWGLLHPSRDRIRALSPSGTAGRTESSQRLSHVASTVRRGWRKLTTSGLASGGTPSLKRELYRRRRVAPR